jgi:hypothetical protein
MIIAFTGEKGCGKDTAAAHLIKKYGFERRSFIQQGKAVIAESLGIPIQYIELLKSDITATISVDSKEYHEHSLSFGNYIQKFIESHRKVFGEDFWVEQVLPDGNYMHRNIVISDLRRLNEAERVRELKGVIIRVLRENPPQDARDPDHDSESQIGAIVSHFTLHNDTTPDDFQEELDTLFTDILWAKQSV